MLSLSQKQHKAIAKYFADSPTASLSVWELLTRQVTAAFPSLSLMRNHYAFIGTPHEQIDVVTQISACSVLRPTQSFATAIAIRATTSNFPEFALRLSLGARLEWLLVQVDGNRHEDELFRTLLQAAACNDNALIEQISNRRLALLKKPNNPDYSLVTTAIIALLRGEESRLVEAAQTMVKRRPKAYVKAIQNAVIGIADQSATAFCNGLSQMLKAYASYVYSDDVLAIFDPHALGLFRICQRIHPELTHEFDRSQGLPWDGEYCSWLDTLDDVQSLYEPNRAPDTIREYICDPTEISWGSSFRSIVEKNRHHA